VSRVQRVLALTSGATFAVAVIAACSSSSGLSIKDAATMQLRQDTRNLAAAAAAHDTTGEYTALAALKADAQQASNTRAIDVATLARITASIAQVQSD